MALVKKAVSLSSYDYSWVSVGDPQLKLNDKWGLINPASGLNFRLEDKLKALRKAADFAVEKQVSFFVILGDVFDSLNPGEKLRSLFFECLQELFKNKIPIYILIGNHDTNGIDFNFSSEYQNRDYIEGLTIVDSIAEFDCFIFLSHGYEQPVLSCTPSAKEKILFAHFTIDGVKASTGKELRSQYSLSLLSDFLWFELGDIHKPTEFDNGCYVGSLCKYDWGEWQEEKSFVYSQLKNSEVTSLRIPVNDRPFVQLEVTEETIHTLDGFGKKTKDGVCRVIVSGKKDWIKSVDWKSRKEFLQQHYALVRFDYEYTDQPVRMDSWAANELMTGSNGKPSSNIRSFVEKAANTRKLTKEQLKIGIDLLEESGAV